MVYFYLLLTDTTDNETNEQKDVSLSVCTFVS